MTTRLRLTACLALLLLLAVVLPPAPALEASSSRREAAQGKPTETPAAASTRRPVTPTAAPAKHTGAQTILDRMTVADKVGQLFLVTFPGDAAPPQSDIARLVQVYRVGGVVLLPANGNFRDVPAPAKPVTDTKAVTLTLNTPQQIASLANALQALVIGATETVTATQPVTPTVNSGQKPTPGPTPTPVPSAQIPLFVAVDWPGDDSTIFSGAGGFTPLPSQMALGATWSPDLAEQAGQVVGQELSAAGVNLLFGPTLDVSDVPRPGSKGDLGTRTFGGDPFWVGQLGRAFIRGVRTGSSGAIATVTKHFPGQGASDRRPDDEVATVQKSMEQLRQIELAPFAAVTSGGDPQAAGNTAALMTSHIRYRGLQGNIRLLTPPISLAPQLQDLMALPEFATWRTAGGVLVSDALGVPAIRRYYDPTLTKFPHRQVAQDAFLAGNDLLYLGHFALTDDWPSQMTAITETIQFFQDKYRTDSAFRVRVDASVARILRLKQSLYGGDWAPEDFSRDLRRVGEETGKSGSVTQTVARSAITLIYPGRDELADRMPSAPLTDENIVIFTDARTARACADCAETPLIAPMALEEIILGLYGPNATGQISAEQIRSFSYGDLSRLLAAAPGAEKDLEAAIAAARWIVFAELDANSTEVPESEALRNFLAKQSDSLRDKRLVVISFGAPYYLDTTEISKLTAYFGAYAHTAPFLEAAVRALFREFTPVGALPVSVSGINYDLIRQLEPASGQILSLGPSAEITGSIKVGSQIVLETGVIRDRNGNPVPDGTPVEFNLRYPTESLVLAPKTETTVAGKARTVVALDRVGELWITAKAGDAKDSTRIELRIGGDTPGTIAPVVPTPTPLPTPTPTWTPLPTATAIPTAAPPAMLGPDGRASGSVRPRVTPGAFFYGLVGALLAAAAVFAVRRRNEPDASASDALIPCLSAALWAIVVAWIAYLLYALGWLPGATELQTRHQTWIAGLVTFAAGTLSVLWTGKPKTGA